MHIKLHSKVNKLSYRPRGTVYVAIRRDRTSRVYPVSRRFREWTIAKYYYNV